MIVASISYLPLPLPFRFPFPSLEFSVMTLGFTASAYISFE